MGNKIIVFGASGFLGSKLYDYFKGRGMGVVGTCFNDEREDLIKFDISEPDLESIDFSGAKYAIIASGITIVSECDNSNESYKINVEGTKSLIKQLWENDIFPIWFSSDYVFGGEKGDYTEQDETNPCNNYGEQKKEVEDFLLESGKDFLIARLCKLYSLNRNDDNLLGDTIKKLRDGEELYCFGDQIRSFTDVRDIPVCLDIMMQNNLTGLYNVVAPKSYSRVEFANLVKEKMGIESGKIITGSVDDLELPYKLPKNIFLDTAKLHGVVDFRFRSLIESLDEMAGENDVDRL